MIEQAQADLTHLNRLTPGVHDLLGQLAKPKRIARPDYRVEKGGMLLSLTDLATKIAVPQVLLVEAFGAAVAGNPCVNVEQSGP